MTGAGDTGAGRPLILTAVLDAAAQERFDRLRRLHFPPERNHLAAHVTLFHQLPGAELDAVTDALVEAVRRPPPLAEVTGVRFLGRGVAYALRSPELDAVRAGLAARWRRWLTAQDRAPHRPHLTVQNKVAPERARALHAQLSREFEPEPVAVVALGLWRYLGGPWESLGRHPFTA